MSSDTVIVAENLGKLYRIGQAEKRHDTLVGALASSLLTPVRNFRRLSRLNTFKANGQDHEESEDTIWALRDVSFQVRRGEVLGIIGRNGAGKSTLLKILSRITEPTAGRVRIRGRISSLLEVGTGFHPELTGRENVYLNGTILGMTKPEIDRKFDEIVDFSGVAKFLDTPVKWYSSGMKVRLAFAVAAHLEPEILIVDEVLAVGDAAFQKKCVMKMEEVRHGGRTVLLVSHQMHTVQALTSRAILLEKGELRAIGPTPGIIATYLGSSRNRYDALDLKVGGHGTDSVRVLAVEVSTEEDADPSQVVRGTPIRIDFTVEVHRSLRNANFAIEVSNVEGSTLFSDAWSDQHGSCPNLPKGRHRIRIQLPTQNLRPGVHFIAIVVADNEVDLLAHVAGIELPPVVLPEEADRLVESRRIGLMYVQCAWSIF
jgi:lipopolysaccharide transport system ATP-binding protein